MILPPPSSPLFPYTTLFRSPSSGAASRTPPFSAPPMPSSSRRTGTSAAPSAARSDLRRSEEHTSELQSRGHLVCRLLLEKKKPIRLHPHLHTIHARLLPAPT